MNISALLTVLTGTTLPAVLQAAPVLVIDDYTTELTPDIFLTGGSSDSRVDSITIDGVSATRTVSLEVTDTQGGAQVTTLNVDSGGDLAINASINTKQNFSFRYDNFNAPIDFSAYEAYGILLDSADNGSGADPAWDMTISVTDNSGGSASSSVPFVDTDAGSTLSVPFFFLPGVDFAEITSFEWSVAPGNSTDPFSHDIIFGTMRAGSFSDAVVPVPEPGTIALLTFATVGLLLIVRRRANRRAEA